MKRLRNLLLLLLCTAPATGQAQDPVKEAEALRNDSLYRVEAARISERLKQALLAHPGSTKAGQAYQTAAQYVVTATRALAIRYANSPSGLDALFKLRTTLPKDSLSVLYEGIAPSLQASPNGRHLRAYIQAEQLRRGDRYQPFDCVTADGEAFDWQRAEGKMTLLIRDGMGCMGAEGQAFCRQLRERITPDKLLLLAYASCDSLPELQQLQATYPYYVFIADFKGRESPIHIRYDASAATPYVWFFDADGKLRHHGEGLNFQRINALAKP